MSKIFFTCIGRGHGAPAVPSSKEDWEQMRGQQWLKDLCDRIAATEDDEQCRKLKSQLPVWTPRCAEFRDNHRAEKDALKPLDRIVFDIDEKGHTDEIEAKMVERDGGKWIDIFKVLMLEESVRHGTHVCVKMPVGMTPQKAQERFAKVIGMAVDPAVKNVAGCIYMVHASLSHFIDSSFFEAEAGDSRVLLSKTEGEKATNRPTPTPSHKGRGIDSIDANGPIGDSGYSGDSKISAVPSTEAHAQEDVTTPLPLREGQGGGSLLYHGIPYTDIIAKYWELFNEGHEPCEGDRNVKTYELAMNLRPICDYSLEKMMAVIPRYDNFPEAEYRQTLENALKEPRKGMPYRLRQVLNALKEENGIRATGGTMTMPPPMPKRLPPLVRLLTRNVPWYYKPAVASAVFPALGAHLHGVKFRYWDNQDHEATFMNVLIGRQSVGKGCIKKPIEYILADIVDRDKPNREREAEWKRKNPSGKSKAKDPRPADICIQVLIDNLTDAVFNQRIVDANNNGQRYVYTIVDEIEALKKVTSKGSVDEVSLLIRKAFDNSMAGQERVGADSVSGIAPLRWNWNASTTPPNARRFFMKAVNDGTVSRLDVSTIMLSDDNDEDPVIGIYDSDFADELKPYLDHLEAANGLIECPQSTRLALKMKQENKDTARLFESEAYKVLSFRANVIAWLKGMVLYVAHGYKWSKEIADFVKWTQQYNLWCKMLYFGEQLEQELKEEKVIQKQNGPQNLLDLLRDEFTETEFQMVRSQQGKDGDGKGTLRQWKKRGHIEWDDVQQCWRKSEKYLASHGLSPRPLP